MSHNRKLFAPGKIRNVLKHQLCRPRSFYDLIFYNSIQYSYCSNTEIRSDAEPAFLTLCGVAKETSDLRRKPINYPC